MNAEINALVEKVLNSRAEKGFWLSKAIEEAVTWGKSKARDLKVQWQLAWKSEVEAKAKAIYAACGLNDRGQKA